MFVYANDAANAVEEAILRDREAAKNEADRLQRIRDRYLDSAMKSDEFKQTVKKINDVLCSQGRVNITISADRLYLCIGMHDRLTAAFRECGYTIGAWKGGFQVCCGTYRELSVPEVIISV